MTPAERHADPPRDLWHVTLTTGHGRRSPRSEVVDDIIAALRPVIRRDGDIGGLHFAVLRELLDGRVMHATYTIGPVGKSPAVYCTLCCMDIMHESAWRGALEHYARNPVQTATGTLVEPPVPWLAVEMLPGATECTPDELQIIADAERCLAWALMESVGV